jgi:hypothetical protein
MIFFPYGITSVVCFVSQTTYVKSFKNCKWKTQWTEGQIGNGFSLQGAAQGNNILEMFEYVSVGTLTKTDFYAQHIIKLLGGVFEVRKSFLTQKTLFFF